MPLHREKLTARRVLIAFVIFPAGFLALALFRKGPAMKGPIRPSPEAITEAKRHPNGWVYQIEGHFGPNDAVPPSAIAGAWKVDEKGQIVGEFIPNPKFKGGRP